MKIRMTLTCVVLSLVLVSPLAADNPQSVTIRGETFNIWPIRDLNERGFDIHPVPQARNAAWVYIEAINAYVELPKTLADAFEYAVYTAWPEDQTKLEEYLQQPGNRRAIELAHKAAGMDAHQMPYFYFGDRPHSILSVLLPKISHTRFLTKLMIADARRLEAQQEYDEAGALCATVIRMGKHVGNGMTLIEGLVGIAIWRLGERAVLDMALRRPLSHKQLNALKTEFDDLAAHLPSVHRGLQGERLMGPAIVDELCSRPFEFFANIRLAFEPGNIGFVGENVDANPDDGWGRLELRIGRLICPDRAMKRHMRGYYDKVLERANKGPHAAADMSFDEERYILEVIPKWDVVSRSLLPSLSRAITLGERLKADLAATRAMVAIRIFMLENYGHLPESLDRIEEMLPDGALIDPFSNAPLVYRPANDGFLLYSVGSNLIDDGGREGKSWDELDMVYPFPPEALEPFSPEGDRE